jgi:uncharacterized protein (TIGR04255 family)
LLRADWGLHSRLEQWKRLTQKTLIRTMNDRLLHLENAPIIESILDIDCEIAPGFDFPAVEAEIHSAVRAVYPKMRHALFQAHEISQKGEAAPELSIRQGLQALQFLTVDEKQIIQFRAGGFSFNRLAPYSHLDDYLCRNFPSSPMAIFLSTGSQLGRAVFR